MLERTASCIEPASQLFLRRFEAPIRTHRALDQSFWRNGGNQLDVPAWWPLYLKRIRASNSHDRENAVASARLASSTSLLAGSPEALHRRGRRDSKRNQKSASPSTRPSRYYTRLSASLQRIGAAPVIEIDASPYHTPLRATGDGKQEHIGAGNNDSANGVNTLEQQLREILRHPPESSDASANDDNFERAWVLFTQVPNQQLHALAVFNFLARSSRTRYQLFALDAFDLVAQRRKTQEDYERGVRLALKMASIRKALKINREATRRSLHRQSSPLLLLYAVSNRMWSTASEVWELCFKPSPSNPAHLVPFLEETGDSRDLPAALSQLGSQLLEQSPMTSRYSGTLTKVFSHVFAALVCNGKLLSVITPKGLHRLYDLSFKLHCSRSDKPDPSIYFSAINTLAIAASRHDKGTLADLIYRTFRSHLPDWSPPNLVYRSLLLIHRKVESPARTFFDLLDEIELHKGMVSLDAFQLVLSELAHQGDVDGLQEVFFRLSQVHGRPKDISFYTPLLYVYSRLGDVPATERELQTMIEHGLEPNMHCWNILVYAHSRSHEPQRAFEVLRTINDKGLAPDAYTFAILSSIVARTGDTNAVIHLAEQAQLHGIQRDYSLVLGMVESFCNNDQSESAEKIVEDATIARLQGNPTRLWNKLLAHYAFKQDSKAMIRVQQRMAALGVKADGMTHSTFMTALVKMRKTRGALRILRTLSLSQTFPPTAFHYSIILHGFAQEGDRDMASVIYEEMKERFPRLGVRGRLAMLHLQARRQLNNLRPSIEFLQETLAQFSPQDRASNLPQPGLNRRRVVEAVPSSDVEFLASALVRNRYPPNWERAEQLLRRYETLSNSLYLDLPRNTSISIPFLTARLNLLVKAQVWGEVERMWILIVEIAIKKGRPVDVAALISKTPLSPDRYDSHKGDLANYHPTLSVSLPGWHGLAEEKTRFTSMIPTPVVSPSLLDEPGLEILYAQRYILERALSSYLLGLAARGLQPSAMALVAKLEKVGFEMTSKNWNVYIQVLTLSTDSAHWLLAFELFEQKMVANAPAYPILISGRWRPMGDDSSIAIQRRTIEASQPDQLIPTYSTTLHLGRILLHTTKSRSVHPSVVQKIMETAPQTWRYVRQMPYSKDPMQKLVMRRKKTSLRKRVSYRGIRPPFRSGVLGSMSPTDHVPMEWVTGLGRTLNDPQYSQARDLQQAELFEGQIYRPPVAKDEEVMTSNLMSPSPRAVKRREGQLIRSLRRMRKDMALPRMVSDSYIGHPVVPVRQIEEKSKLGRIMSSRSGYRSLVKEAMQRKGLREKRTQALRNISAFAPPPDT